MFYLYFVLPPVLIVISLALVIFLISRKSLEIEREILISNKVENESRLTMEFKSRWLHILEKIAHLFKIFSLRIHNWTEKRLIFIKSKKNAIESDLDKREAEEANGKIESSIKNEDSLDYPGEGMGELVTPEIVNEVGNRNSMDVVRNGKINRIRKMFTKKESIQDTDVDDFFEFREKRVMVSKEVVHPEEKKDELENILVERIATDPRDIEAYERLGDYYVSQGNKADAEACYKQVLKLNPQSLSVRNKLSRFKRQRF
jgi:tetratricopeptide (TPR) repeat protein